MFKIISQRFALSAVLAVAASTSSAAIVTYSAGDTGASTRAQLANAGAAQAAFIAATPTASTITFDAANPAGVTIAGGFVSTNCGGSGELYGFNTTAGGANILCVNGGSVTFTFATPIDAFGLFITGLQSTVVTDETLTFSDGSSQSLSPASITNGGAFLGFTDVGKLITSVTYNATRDVVGLDDIRFRVAGAAAVVPEPETLALFGIALVGLAAARRRRR